MGDSCPTPPVGSSCLIFLAVNEGWVRRGGARVTSVSGFVAFLRREGVNGGCFNELLKRTQTLVNKLRAGEPSGPVLGPGVSDPLVHPYTDSQWKTVCHKQKLKQVQHMVHVTAGQWQGAVKIRKKHLLI